MTDALQPPEPPDEKELKRREKEARRAETDRGVLDPALRYRALINAVEAGQDLIELADKKARFALIIISVLNAVAIVLAVRGGESLIPRTGSWALVIQMELVVYVGVTVYYIFQAIETLRPRGTRSGGTDTLPSSVEPGTSMRVLFYSDIVRRDRAAYRRIWEDLRQDNLNVELAEQMHTIAGINQSKFVALARLYAGVRVMAIMLAITLATIAASHLGR